MSARIVEFKALLHLARLPERFVDDTAVQR
jgi:hypothetical protein